MGWIMPLLTEGDQLDTAGYYYCEQPPTSVVISCYGAICLGIMRDKDREIG